MNPMARLITLLLVVAIMLSSAAAQALTPTREQVREGWERRFQELDKNRDGKVSLEELPGLSWGRSSAAAAIFGI